MEQLTPALELLIRRRFEVWMLSQVGYGPNHLRRSKNGMYTNQYVQAAYAGYVQCYRDHHK